MIYFIITANHIEDDTAHKVYLMYDEDSETQYWWSHEFRESKVHKFSTLESITDFITNTDEFNTILNTGENIVLPELLDYIEKDSITVEEMRYFEPVEFIIDLATLYETYNERKALFDTKKQELNEI
jgi:hypothetical protein